MITNTGHKYGAITKHSTNAINITPKNRNSPTPRNNNNDNNPVRNNTAQKVGIAANFTQESATGSPFIITVSCPTPG